MNINKYIESVDKFTYEELAFMLYMKGERDGYRKVTDKTKWREPVMAEKLGHKAHKAISAGAGSDEYGSDAYDEKNDMYAEYKTVAICDDDELSRRKLLGMKSKTGREVKSYEFKGIYNGAYTDEAITEYAKKDHYFGVFFKEICVMIIKPKTEKLIEQLTYNHVNRKKGKSTNLNTAKFLLDDFDNYEIAFDNRKFLRDYV